jgi:hypothetical protein
MSAIFASPTDGDVRRVVYQELFDLVLRWHSQTHGLFTRFTDGAVFLFQIEIPDKRLQGKIGRVRTCITPVRQFSAFKPYRYQSLRRAPEYDNERWAWRYGQTSALVYSEFAEEGSIPMAWQVCPPQEVRDSDPTPDSWLFGEDGALVGGEQPDFFL